MVILFTHNIFCVYFNIYVIVTYLYFDKYLSRSVSLYYMCIYFARLNDNIFASTWIMSSYRTCGIIHKREDMKAVINMMLQVMNFGGDIDIIFGEPLDIFTINTASSIGGFEGEENIVSNTRHHDWGLGWYKEEAEVGGGTQIIPTNHS